MDLNLHAMAATAQAVAILTLAAGSPVKGEITAHIPGAGATRLRLDCLAHFNVAGRPRGLKLTSPTREGLREAHAELVRAASRSSSGAIPVTRAGKGPTERSVKVRVAGVRIDDDRRGGDEPACDRTLTVARSQLREVGGQLYAPAWLLRTTIKDRLGFWPVLPPGEWPEAEMVWREFFEPLVPLVEEWAAGEAMKRLWLEDRRQKVEAEAAEREAARQARLEAAGQAEQAAQARRQAKHAARLGNLLTITAARVSWREWVKTGNYQNRGGYYVEVSHENVVLKISGSRAYVLLEDGEEVIKSVDSITWEPAAGPRAVGQAGGRGD